MNDLLENVIEDNETDEVEEKTITEINISLDEDVPECMAGVERPGSVSIAYDDGSTEEDDSAIDNTEYFAEDPNWSNEMIKDIAAHYGVSEDIVSIEGY
jgi:hypothetical protein